MDYAQRQRDPTKHLLGIVFVGLLHVFLVYALVTGLARKVVDVIKKPIETKLVEEVKPPPPPPEAPPPPPPKLTTPPPPFIPPPEVQISVPVPVTQTITAVTTTPPPAPVAIAPAAPPAPAHVPVRVAPSVRVGKDCPEPDYPAASKRLEEIGEVRAKFLVDVDGHVIKAEVEKSSGHRRLDDSVIAALMSCKAIKGVGTVDGKPEQSWGRVIYTFRLVD
jgi:protein TonB